ncbi:MAG: GNAT family N-acetyltransferase [Chloroflexi bacterium]|nr:GNAT family N-acetyltransferase [Chloroflexota bacterium]MCC6895370.1 GNAT family N-acetyltransferase [Anaerolineae bacterium]
MMTNAPLALQTPPTSIAMRPVRATDTDHLRVNCWPNRSFLSIYNLITRTVRNVSERRGLGLVVVGADDAPLAYGQYTIWPTCAEISDLVVAEPLRGQGVGTALIQTLIKHAQAQRATAFEIGVAIDNPRAAALYRRLGFEDSHTVMMSLERGMEKIQFLRLETQ